MKAKITVTAYSSENQEYLRGLASVTIDDKLRLSQIKINESSKGLYVAMPQTQGKDTAVDEKTGLEKPKYYDIYHPITAQFGSELRKSVLDAFKSLLEKGDKTLTAEVDFKGLDNLNAEVTRVNTAKNNFDKNLLGYAEVVFGGAVAVNGIRIREHEGDKPYVFLPSYYNKTSGTSKEYCETFGKDFGEAFKDTVRKAYFEKLSENTKQAQKAAEYDNEPEEDLEDEDEFEM